MTFSDAAPRWCWLAASALGWRPAEFWQATPSELCCALRHPEDQSGTAAPSRDLINTMMERDAHARQF